MLMVMWWWRDGTDYGDGDDGYSDVNCYGDVNGDSDGADYGDDGCSHVNCDVMVMVMVLEGF